MVHIFYQCSLPSVQDNWGGSLNHDFPAAWTSNYAQNFSKNAIKKFNNENEIQIFRLSQTSELSCF